MFSDTLLFAMLYSAITGFAMSFGAMYLVHIVRVFWRHTEFGSGRHERLLRACQSVRGVRIGTLAGGSKNHRIIGEVYKYTYNNKEYQHIYRGVLAHQKYETLFFLSNPASACLEDELKPRKFVWTKYVFPLGLALTAMLFRYFYHWMELIAAGV